MKRILSALLTSSLIAGLALSGPAAADTTAPAKKHVSKKSHAKKSAPASFELAAPDEDDTGAAIDPKNALVTDYQCELGANVTIFRNDGDDKYIALQWQKLITRMARVGTTTGANRFENKRSGLVWIGIPAKGILLDAKNGHQLANECKDARQAAPKAVAIVPAAVPATPVAVASPVPADTVVAQPAVTPPNQ
jgi:hypothetical protein